MCLDAIAALLGHKTLGCGWYVNRGDHCRRSHPGGVGLSFGGAYVSGQAAGSRVTVYPWACSLATRRRVSISGSTRLVK